MTRLSRARRITLAFVVSVSVSAGGCGEKAPPVEKQSYQIAFVSGAGDATAARRGLDLAVEELNADSAGPYRFEVSAVDGGSDAASATAACEKLVAEPEVGAIVGLQSGPTLEACNAVASGAGLPYLSIGGAAGEVCAENLYHIAPLPNQLAAGEETARGIAARQPGTLRVSDYFQEVQLPANDTFLAALREGDAAAVATPESVRAHDAVHLLAAALRQAGSADRPAVLAALPGATVDGPRGPVSFPAGGRFATLNLYIGRPGDGAQIRPVSFMPAVAPAPACG
ncbi:MAG: ABC transporter substrate-binding protein [Gemmatimonadetes bacterium]|nr:ABC transporter substrate-binding protein [Gemmatimonadota bacterium]